MFVKLNKKILYSLMVFLVLIAGIFLVIFINLYSQKLHDNQNSIYIRNQYVLDLLNDNINLRKKLVGIMQNYPEIEEESNLQDISKSINLTEKELTREQKLNAELQKNYSNNQEALITGAKIVGFSLIVIILFILLIIFLMDYWVIRPVEKLIEISRKVSMGIFSSRLPIKEESRFRDEFDILFSTFNIMLDNTEYNIEMTKARERFLQQLIDSIPDAIRVIDKDYNVIMANTAFYHQFKIKTACIGEKCYRAYGYACEGCEQSKYNCPIKYLTEKKDGYLHTIHEVGKIPLYVNAAKLYYGNKEDEYYIVESMHDLSSDVRFSHQQKVSSLGFLSTSIAHEMKNNLGAIRMILEGLIDSEYKDVPDSDRGKKYLLMAYKQLVESVKTPERLLRLAQYSENEKSEINIESAVKDMMLMIDYDAKRRGIVVKTEIEQNVNIIGNEADFKMIILNLAQNAIKAMPDGGKLSVWGSLADKEVILKVADTGVGIEEDKLKHIFEPFYSASKQTKSSGLGLAIVNSLIEKFKGKIEVSSVVGQGTTFTLHLPLPKKNTKKS